MRSDCVQPSTLQWATACHRGNYPRKGGIIGFCSLDEVELPEFSILISYQVLVIWLVGKVIVQHMQTFFRLRCQMSAQSFRAHRVVAVASLKPFLMMVLRELNTLVFPALQIKRFPFILSSASFICRQNPLYYSQFVAVNYMFLFNLWLELLFHLQIVLSIFELLRAGGEIQCVFFFFFFFLRLLTFMNYENNFPQKSNN